MTSTEVSTHDEDDVACCADIPAHLQLFPNPFSNALDLQQELHRQNWAVNWRDTPKVKNILPCGPVSGFFNTVEGAGEEIECPFLVFLNAPCKCSKGGSLFFLCHPLFIGIKVKPADPASKSKFESLNITLNLTDVPEMVETLREWGRIIVGNTGIAVDLKDIVWEFTPGEGQATYTLLSLPVKAGKFRDMMNYSARRLVDRQFTMRPLVQVRGVYFKENSVPLKATLLIDLVGGVVSDIRDVWKENTHPDWKSSAGEVSKGAVSAAGMEAFLKDIQSVTSRVQDPELVKRIQGFLDDVSTHGWLSNKTPVSNPFLHSDPVHVTAPVSRKKKDVDDISEKATKRLKKHFFVVCVKKRGRRSFPPPPIEDFVLLALGLFSYLRSQRKDFFSC